MTDRTPRHRSGKGRDAGFALLLVLWTLGFLALLVSQMLMSARSSLQLGHTALTLAALETTADAAITTELFSIAVSDRATGGVNSIWHPLKGESGGAQVRSRLERGKINPNTITQATLNAFFLEAGFSSDQSRLLAGQIFTWRNPEMTGQSAPAPESSGTRCVSTGALFRTQDDLVAVPGMTASILRQISPYLSFSQQQQPSSAMSEGAVKKALQRMKIGESGEDGTGDEDSLIKIDARVITKDGAMQRHAEAILLPDARPTPWKIMRWETQAVSP